MAALLEVNGLTKRFGGTVAVDGTTFQVEAGSLVGLIGPNGSGKTTTLNLINGAHAPDSGVVSVNGQNLAGSSSTSYVKAGVTRTFQNARVFSTITALENMLIPVLHTRSARGGWTRKAQELLDYVGLLDHQDTPASELSGGQQKLLEFVRALMTDPVLMLMDEPFAGVHPSVKELMRQRITEQNEKGTAFLIVSHEIPDLTRLCPRLIAMSDGEIIADGNPQEVTGNQKVITAYLGRGPSSRTER